MFFCGMVVFISKPIIEISAWSLIITVGVTFAMLLENLGMLKSI